MELALVFIGVPIATYLALAFLPRGRPALYGLLAAALALLVLWVTLGMGSTDSYMVALIGFLFSATARAAIVQMLRRAIGVDKPRWVYPAVVIGVLLLAGIPMLTVLGV